MPWQDGGAWLLTGDARKVGPRAVVTNPVLVAAVLGLVVYLAAEPLPAFVPSGRDLLAVL